MFPEARVAGARSWAGLKIGEMACRLGRRAGRICQEDKGGRLGRLLRKGIVEDEAEHAALGDIVGPDRDLVGLAFAVPCYRDEALLGQLVLSGAGISLSEEAGLGLDDAVCVLFGPAQFVGMGAEVRRARAWVFNDGEVSGTSGSAHCLGTVGRRAAELH